jgi:hypothetical protein
MAARLRRGAAMAFGAAAMLALFPSPGFALFDWLFPPPGAYYGVVNTCYAPPFSGQIVGFAPRYVASPWRPATPTPAVIAPTVASYCYVATDSYRPESRLVPVTTFRPVSFWDASTGAVVAYRPAVTWVYRPVAVPYSSYRVLPSLPAAARPAYSLAAPAPVSATGCPTCVQTVPSPGGIAPIPSSGAAGVAPSLIGPTPPMSPPPATVPVTPPAPTAVSPPPPTAFSPAVPAAVPTPPPSMGPPSSVATPPASSVSKFPTPGPVTAPVPLSAPVTVSPPNRAATGAVAPSASQNFARPLENHGTLGTEPSSKASRDSNTGSAPDKIPSPAAPLGRTAAATIRQAVYVRPVDRQPQAGAPARPQSDTSGWEAAGD